MTRWLRKYDRYNKAGNPSRTEIAGLHHRKQPWLYLAQPDHTKLLMTSSRALINAAQAKFPGLNTYAVDKGRHKPIKKRCNSFVLKSNACHLNVIFLANKYVKVRTEAVIKCN